MSVYMVYLSARPISANVLQICLVRILKLKCVYTDKTLLNVQKVFSEGKKTKRALARIRLPER